MSKKRPTESSWDSDEELLSDTAGISAFPKTSELDLLAEDGELDEEALLGLDESGAAFNNDSVQPVANRQRSKGMVSSQQSHEPHANHAFVFEVADTGDLEDELTVNELETEMVGTYNNEGIDSFSHDVYHQNGNEGTSEEIAPDDGHNAYDSNMISEMGDYKNAQDNYDGSEMQAGQTYSGQPGHYSDMTGNEEGQHEDTSNIELGYDQPAEQSDQVLLEYDVTQQQNSSEQYEVEQGKGPQKETYESDSESDEDSRHNRGKFTSERTGVISLSATTERETIPDTLEINEEQANQIKEFMSDKPQRGRGRGGRNNRGRQSAHNRLGNRPGMRPQSGQGGMMNVQRMNMMNQRFQSPSNSRGMPRALMNQRVMFGGLRQQMPQRGHVMRELLNPMFLGARGPHQGGGRFPGGPLGPVGPQGPLPMLGPSALLEPMKHLLQRMRSPHPGSPRITGQGAIQRPGGHMGNRMPGLGNVMGGHGPRPFIGSPRAVGPNRMLRPPQLSPTQAGPLLTGPVGSQPFPTQQNQLRQAQPNKGRLPPHQRLGQMGATNRGQMQGPRGPAHPRAPFTPQPGRHAGSKIFINPLFQGQQGGPSGLTRTVKMGAPVQQKKARALLEKAKQTHIKPANSSGVPVKRKSTGGDDLSAKVVKRDYGKEESTRVVEKQQPAPTDTKKISSLLEEQKRKREMIQKRKELARQRQAEEKRKELEEKMKTEGKKIESIVSRSSGSDQRTVEKSDNAEPIKVVSRSIASRLGPPPAQKVPVQMRGAPPQPIRGPPLLQQRGPHPQQMRGPQPQLRGPQPQQMRTPQPQLRGNPSSFLRGPPQQGGSQKMQQTRDIQQRLGGQQQQPQLRGPPPQQIRGPPLQQIRGPPPQLIGGPPPQLIGGPQQQIRGAELQQVRNPQAQQIRGPVLQQMRGQIPQQIGGPQLQQLRGPPPQQIRGPQLQIRVAPPQNVEGPRPQHLRGPAPQQITGPHGSRPLGPSQVNPVQPQGPRMVRGPPPPSNQFLAQPPPSSTGYQGPPPLSTPGDPRFSSSPFPHNQQQSHATYNVGAPPTSTIYQPAVNTQPPAQVHPPHFASPSPQQHLTGPSYSHAAITEPAQAYSYPAQLPHQQPISGYQQSYHPPQQDYQQPAAPVYSAPYPPAHNPAQIPPQAQNPAIPDYQNSQRELQAYPSQQASYPPAVSTYQNPPQTQQHYIPQQEAQSSFPLSHEPSYQPADDYYSAPQPIQTIQTVTNQPVNLAHTEQGAAVGQKIQTIGQRIQPVTGTQMRSIIHNVASTSQSSTPARSVQQRTPTLHISRAVMEGNVPVLPGSQKVIILNVPQMATRETLIRLCRHFGHVEGVNLMREQNKAVVQFQRGEQAAKCVSKCDQKCLHKTRLTVKLLPS